MNRRVRAPQLHQHQQHQVMAHHRNASAPHSHHQSSLSMPSSVRPHQIHMGHQQQQLQQQQKLYDTSDMSASFFYPIPEDMQYHLYTAPLPSSYLLPANHHVLTFCPNIFLTHTHAVQSSHFFFVHEGLREALQRRNDEASAMLDPQVSEAMGIPQELHVYHSLYPMEEATPGLTVTERSSKILRLPTFVYRATNGQDGMQYILRRIEGVFSFKMCTESCVTF